MFSKCCRSEAKIEQFVASKSVGIFLAQMKNIFLLSKVNCSVVICFQFTDGKILICCGQHIEVSSWCSGRFTEDISWDSIWRMYGVVFTEIAVLNS